MEHATLLRTWPPDLEIRPPLITFCVSRRRRKMYCGHARLCVCLSVCLSFRGLTPILLHGPGCNLGRRWGCPLVVHYWADLQSVHGLRCYGNITWTLVYAGCARVADYWPAGDGGVLKIARRISQVGVDGWPVTGRRRGGVLNITAAAMDCGLPMVAFWRHNANAKCYRVHARTRSMPVVIIIAKTVLLCMSLILSRVSSSLCCIYIDSFLFIVKLVNLLAYFSACFATGLSILAK